MNAPPTTHPATERAAGSGEAKSLDVRMEQERRPAGHRGHRGRLAQSLVQAAIAILMLAVMLVAILWSRSAPTHSASADRKQQRPDNIHVGQVVVGQGSSDCRTLSFDNSTGTFGDGAPEPCLSSQRPPPQGYQRGRFEAVRKQFSKPGD